MGKVMKNSRQYAGTADDLLEKVGSDPSIMDLTDRLNYLDNWTIQKEWQYVTTSSLVSGVQTLYVPQSAYEIYIEVPWINTNYTYVYSFYIPVFARSGNRYIRSGACENTNGNSGSCTIQYIVDSSGAITIKLINLYYNKTEYASTTTMSLWIKTS